MCLQSVVAKGLLVSIADQKNYVPVFLNFSAQTSSFRTQEMIEGKLEKKRKNILGWVFSQSSTIIIIIIIIVIVITTDKYSLTMRLKLLCS